MTPRALLRMCAAVVLSACFAQPPPGCTRAPWFNGGDVHVYDELPLPAGGPGANGYWAACGYAHTTRHACPSSPQGLPSGYDCAAHGTNA